MTRLPCIIANMLNASPTTPARCTNDSRLSLLRAAFAILGLFLLVQFVLGAMGIQRGVRANIWWWTALSTLAAERGFFNVWTPYPPLFTLLHYGLVKGFGGPTDLLARYFFEGDRGPEAVAAYEVTLASMKGIWACFQAAFLAGHAALVYALARAGLRPREATLSAVAFVLFNLSWCSQIVIGVTCDQFDYIPSFFFLLGLLWLSRGRVEASALAAAAGVLTKIYPGLLIPLAWASLKTARRGALYTGVCAGACLIAVTPFLRVNPDIFMATYQWSASRPGWESVWSYDSAQPERKPFPPMPVPAAMVGLFDSPVPNVVLVLDDGQSLPGREVREQAGHVTLEFWNGERIEVERRRVKAVLQPRSVERKDRMLMAATLAALLAAAWFFRRAIRCPSGLLRGALLFVLILLFFSKGVSSYFLLWFFPLLFVVYRPLAACGLFSLFLVAGNLEFVGGLKELPYYWPSIFLRQVLFAALAADQAIALYRLTEKVDGHL